MQWSGIGVLYQLIFAIMSIWVQYQPDASIGIGASLSVIFSVIKTLYVGILYADQSGFIVNKKHHCGEAEPPSLFWQRCLITWLYYAKLRVGEHRLV